MMPVPDRWMCGLIVAIWMAAPFGDFPKPHVDDLFFTGTAINLAQGGPLENPWLAEWSRQFGTTVFWQQPPLHPFALSAWLRVFGIGPVSLLAFTTASAAVLSVSVYILLRRRGVGIPLACGALLSIAHFVSAHGLRPDVPSLALAALAALCWTTRASGWWIAGCICGALAAAMHPFAITVVAPPSVCFGSSAATIRGGSGPN